MIRHAYAPGTGDPPGFSIGECATQRNLSEEGRLQSRRIGDFLRAHGIEAATVYSSQWCRCLETARLLAFGPVEELPALNSFFEVSARGPAQTAQLSDFLVNMRRERPVILVTHQVNITALTGVNPISGEIIIYQVVNNGPGKVLARLTP